MICLKSTVFKIWLLLLGSSVFGQTWQYEMPNFPHSSFHSAVQAPGAGYIVTGYAGGNGNGLVILKINDSGKEEWKNIYPDPLYKNGNYIIELADGNYAVIGNGAVNQNGTNNWVLKIDLNGNIIWSKLFGYAFVNFGLGGGAAATPDGGFIFCKNKLIKISPDGELQWIKEYGPAGKNTVAGVSQIEAGGFILTGWSENYFPDHIVAFLIKTDSLGNEEWVSFPKHENIIVPTLGYDVIPQNDGYIVVGIDNSSFEGGIILWKTDLTGKTIWYKRQSGNIASKIVEADGGGFAFTGMSFNGNIFLTITDSLGNEIQRINYSDKENGYGLGCDIITTENNSFLLAGFIQKQTASHAILIKTQP